MTFRDRASAGRALAERLLGYRHGAPVVLALPRGGVPVGYEVAKQLGAPLDLVLVRKIGAPGQAELAIGAVVDGANPEIVLNDDIVRLLNVPDDYIESETARQIAEIERRRSLYLGGRAQLKLAGRTVLVVDDGIATGATTRVALHAIRRSGPARLVLAVPVAPPETIEALKGDADDIVCLLTPSLFGAISLFYGDFRQVDDREVTDLLDRRARELDAETSASAADSEGGGD
jgi:putative phosphoribosyl transferase